MIVIVVTVHIVPVLALHVVIQGVDVLLPEVNVRIVHPRHPVHPVVHHVVPAVVVFVVLIF